MKTFPMFLKVAGRRVVIVGGGEQAAQKARLVLKTEAYLVLASPELDPELADLVASGRARQVAAPDAAVFADAALVFIATGCPGADAAWHGVAKSRGATVNVVDQPDLCDALTPSIVDRDPVVVAIGTEGTAPVLGRRIKTRIEEMLHPRLGTYAALAGRMRAEVARRIPRDGRRPFWRWVFGGAPWTAFSTGAEREAIQQIKTAIASGDRGGNDGLLTIVLNATDAEMIPLMAIQRLQEADVIFVDRGVPERVLELARRDAERVRVTPRHDQAAPDLLARQLVQRAAEPGAVVYLSVEAAPLPIAAVPGSIRIEQTRAAVSLGSGGPVELPLEA